MMRLQIWKPPKTAIDDMWKAFFLRNLKQTNDSIRSLWIFKIIQIHTSNWEVFFQVLTCNRPSRDLAMVMHLVFGSWVVIAFSNSSMVPFFFNFFTSDLTAFSLHFSSCSFLASPFRHPSSRFTIGGVKGSIELILIDVLIKIEDKWSMKRSTKVLNVGV